MVFKQLFTFFKARCFIAVSQFQNIGNYFHYSNFEIGMQCENHIIEIACLNILQLEIPHSAKGNGHPPKLLNITLFFRFWCRIIYVGGQIYCQQR
jgi:hypothetical protein